LFTRTRDFADGFAQSLELLDRLILLDIYPARELPIEGVTSAMIFKNVKITDKIMCTKEQLPEILAKSKIEILITLGAGDIDKLVEPIKQLLLKKAGL
jgi:UDP-N-acetylmuramate--alanine ligase